MIRAARRRGLLDRPLVVFAVLLLGPAAGFCVLGWNSLEREHDWRLREMGRAARDILDARVAEAAGRLRALAAREAQRHYYEYQREFLPREQVVEALSFQESPLVRDPDDALVRGWFQWELFDHRAYEKPDVFPPDRVDLREEVAAGYGPTLRAHLERAPESLALRLGSGRIEAYSQRVVAANEERGALQEELAVRQRDAETRGSGAVAPPYLESFESRARETPIDVRYGRLQWLARPAGPAGPPLVAWRMVWIPGEQTAWREVKRDRWLLQGFAVDPRPLLPAGWETVAQAQVARADVVGRLQAAWPTASLAAVLDAEPVVGGSLPATLTLVARAHRAAADAAWRDARNRFLLLVAGLVVVVGVGFAVLVRGVRRDILLARRKEDFVAAVTHELKTPLTGIRMYADMLREGWVSEPEAAARHAGKILEEAERLGHLVDQVLDLAALEHGVAAVDAVPGDLGEAVRGATALMAGKAQGAGVTLRTEVAEDLPLVRFDPRLVRPLVLNLVDNAIKYSARAEAKEVDVSVRREGDRALLRVADRGMGIPAGARRSLFRPFQRAGDELTRAAPGIGIGLALVKRYADAHRARLSLASVPGEGTVVEVRFPT